MKKYKFDRNKVFTNLPEDIAEATKRIGELVAVNDILVRLKDSVEKGDFYPLSMSSHLYYPYRLNSSDGYLDYSHCIFMNDLETEEEEEPKYREFKNDLEFFENIGHIGEVITFRFKVTITKSKDTYYKEVISQIHYIDDKVYIKLHDTWFTLETLFKELEICLNGEWKPFGITD